MSIKNPIIINQDKQVHFDVDDTLVMWDDKFREPGPGKVEFIDPHDGTKLYLTPHKKHIQKLRGHSRTGWYVVVWSAGGWEWAETVIRALGLIPHVDMIMSKPLKCYDDLPVGEGIGPREWYKDKKTGETNESQG